MATTFLLHLETSAIKHGKNLGHFPVDYNHNHWTLTGGDSNMILFYLRGAINLSSALQ